MTIDRGGQHRRQGNAAKSGGGCGGPDDRLYFVTIGEGRRLAQLQRAKRKQIGKTEAVRSVLDTANDAHEISLDENITREAGLKVIRD
ncbi:hypothetical protein GCM10010869_45180 [Mesorhizobium tianshanense]|nr:hypothetical protein GCM10010869_45180 [Mesorhizobium tianshanense]